MDHGEDTSVEALATAFRSGEGLAAGSAPAGSTPGPEHGHGHGRGRGAEPGAGSTSMRRFEHRGHRVAIETTYRITIDDRPLQGHVEVLPSGAVHYHAFPQYAPQSAVDVVKTVIDTVWDRPVVEDELARPDDGDALDDEPPGGHHRPHGSGAGPRDPEEEP